MLEAALIPSGPYPQLATNAGSGGRFLPGSPANGGTICMATKYRNYCPYLRFQGPSPQCLSQHPFLLKMRFPQRLLKLTKPEFHACFTLRGLHELNALYNLHTLHDVHALYNLHALHDLYALYNLRLL